MLAIENGKALADCVFIKVRQCNDKGSHKTSVPSLIPKFKHVHMFIVYIEYDENKSCP